MSKFWFTSDTHFGHSNIIRYCKRPFVNKWVMDEALIERWNGHVRPNDVVYHLGDFAFGSGVDAEYARRIKCRLHGQVHLITGNHEEAALGISDMFRSVQPYLELHKQKQLIVLFHYPLRTWRNNMRGSWHLYGHCHGGIEPRGRSFDIGVDCWDYRPLSFEELETKLSDRPIYAEDKPFVCSICKSFPCKCEAKDGA